MKKKMQKKLKNNIDTEKYNKINQKSNKSIYYIINDNNIFFFNIF